MRKRLIELIKNAHRVAIWHNYNINEYIADALLAEGIILPPVKVGDTLYCPISIGIDTEPNMSEIFCGKVLGIVVGAEDVYIAVCYNNGVRYSHREIEIGKTVFLTKEEAEQALAEGRKR